MSTRPRRKPRWFRRILLLIGLAVIGGLVALFWPTGPIQVGYDTTRLTGPLNADGTVNYLAALDAEWAEGVTPENNAAVLLVQAFGPDLLPEEKRDEIISKLGVTELPPPEDRFIPLDKVADEPGEAATELDPSAGLPARGRAGSPVPQASRPVPRPGGDSPDAPPSAPPPGSDSASPAAQPTRPRDQLSEAVSRPWTEAEFPLLARWIELNERPARLLVEATHRPRLYVPMVSSSEPPNVIDVLVPGVSACLDLGRFLAARAMLRAGHGYAEGAWQDVLATIRLARLVGQHPYLFGQMVAVRIDDLAMKAAWRLAAGGTLTAEQARAMRAEIEKLAPPSDLVKTIDASERYLMLDAIAMAYRGMSIGQLMSGMENSMDRFSRLLPLNWNRALRMTNGYYDRTVQRARRPFLERQSPGQEGMDPRDEMLLKGNLGGLALRGPTVLFTGRLLRLGMPSLNQARVVEEQAEMTRRLTVVAFALAEWKAAKGGYPDALDALVPDCLAKVPTDLFTGRPVIYRREGDGYLLYSVGPNMKDDGGKTGKEGVQFDDIVVEAARPPATLPAGGR